MIMNNDINSSSKDLISFNNKKMGGGYEGLVNARREASCQNVSEPLS